MQHTSLSYQRGRHNLSVGNVTLKSNSALKKREKYQIFMYLPTYVPVSLVAQLHSVLIFFSLEFPSVWASHIKWILKKVKMFIYTFKGNSQTDQS